MDQNWPKYQPTGKHQCRVKQEIARKRAMRNAKRGTYATLNQLKRVNTEVYTQQ